MNRSLGRVSVRPRAYQFVPMLMALRLNPIRLLIADDDLPWNPNRLEQREGRVDRFGQPARKVKAVLFYGRDNSIDGAVLDVLLRKAAVWAEARQHYEAFQHRLQRLDEDDSVTTITRNQWGIPLLSLLGYELSYMPSAAVVDGKKFTISHRPVIEHEQAESAPPVHIVSCLQSLDRRPESGRSRMAPHSLIQQYLNRTEHLWGIITNGETIRLLRDSQFMSRLAYIELDLCGMKDFLSAIWYLSMYREDEQTLWRRVNYSALDVEELGSVYESLLDYYPVFSENGQHPVFHFVEGTKRKSTGSYYTPHELIQELIKSARAPVVEKKLEKERSKETLLSIKVCDPACGSGHFLLAAARYLGKELARIRTGEEEPGSAPIREAIRYVIAHCIYGVDLNPLAVDLCKVVLWIEGHCKGKPLTFLDHRIKRGNSLVGVLDPNVFEKAVGGKSDRNRWAFKSGATGVG